MAMKDSSSDPRITLPGYCILQKIYENSRTLIYRGRKTSDQIPVVIKLIKAEQPTLAELARCRNQYAVAKNLDLPNVVHPLALHNFHNGFALILEDFGGVSLQEYSTPHPLSIPLFLNIAAQLAIILEGLYEYRVIHKDIKPSNILIHPQTQQVKLTDFSLASLLPRETQAFQNPTRLEGTLAYMSPEQTGRMNRRIDYRTDFYSLGVTFYQLLTGQLPFPTTDPMELIHCHIAQELKPPCELNPTVPEMVSEIVMKLMAKTAEERYQNPLGLRCDLEACLAQYTAHDSIAPFKLGRQDISERFQISEKLYGREQEVATLFAAFDRVAGRGSELMLVTGFSGIGKTTLINEAHKLIARQQSYFIKGKFDQLQRNLPFSALVQAFRDLINQLLSENEVRLKQWRNRILEALKDNGQVIIDIMPELEQVIGPQSPVPELSGKAAQNRFNLLFQRLIQVFTSQEQPLVILLDNLQWADFDSLGLIQWVMGETETDHLLLIGAYRDNEVSPSHPLMLTLDQIRKTQTTVNTITLKPLKQVDVNAWIADTLSCSTDVTGPLAELVYQQTEGNPFFTVQLLNALYEAGLITVNRDTGYWQCDIAQVKALALTPDAVALMARQLGKLPEKTQRVLQQAACLGDRFDLATLAIVCENSEAEISVDLWPALQAGLILPGSELYKFYLAPSHTQFGILNPASQISYRFSHDQIQQAANSLIPEDQKQRKHLRIGRLLLKHAPAVDREKRIFEIVNQLNYGLALISDQRERDELAQLNLTAGDQAKAVTAYQSSLKYFITGIELLATGSWETSYDLTLVLYQNAAEAAYLSGEFGEMAELAKIVLKEAKTLLDKVKICELKTLVYTAQNRLLEAVDNSLSLAKQLGAKLPQDPSKLTILLGLAKTKSSLFLRNPSNLIVLPPMTNATALATMRVLLSVGLSAYVAVPQLAPLIVFKLVGLSVQYGNAPQSPYGYAAYGLILCGKLGEIEAGYKFGQLALELLQQFPAREIESKTLFLVTNFIQHWKAHIRETLPPFLKGYQIGLETGDLEFAALHGQTYAYYAYFAGEELGVVAQNMADYGETIRQFKQPLTLTLHRVYWQTVLNLLNPIKSDPEHSEEPVRDPCYLMGDVYDEQVMLPLPQGATQRSAIYHLHFNKLVLCYLFRQPQQALANAEIARKYLDSVTGLFAVPLLYFYDSLARLAVLAEMRHDSSHRQTQTIEKLLARVNAKRMFDQVGANQKKLQKWAHHAPMNHLHKFYLVEAEKHRVLGQMSKAVDLYDLAIAGAKQNKFIQEEALAKELTARFYLEWDKAKIAQTYLTEAYYAYARWQAKAKVEDLESHYPELLLPILHQTLDRQTRTALQQQFALGAFTEDDFGSGVNIEPGLDLSPVIKISQVLSDEISLDGLLTQLMKIFLDNAGAEKGSLILSRDDQLFLEASASASSDQVIVGQSILLDVLATSKTMSSLLPTSIIHAVVRTLEPIVLDHAAVTDLFMHDPYIGFWQPQSIVCQPILGQGKLIGILYLENNSTTGAFTRDRIELLKLLCSQTAIALENTRLYDCLKDYSQTLEAKVEQRTEELQQQTQALQQQMDDRLQAEVALSQSEAKFFTVFCSSPEPITIIELEEERLIEVNDSFCQISGYSQADLIGRSALELNLWENHQAQSGFLETLKDKGRIRNQKLDFRTQSGELRTVLISADAIELDNRLCGLTVVNDITEQKQAERALKQAKESAEAANRAKSEFLSQMSHELRTSLNAILSFSQMLKQDPTLNPDHQKYLGIIDRSGEHLLALIDDVLTMSKIEAERIPLNPQQFDLHRLLNSLPEILQLQAQSKNLQLVFDRTPDVPQWVTTDEVKLRQVLINLLGNAIQFTAAGSVTLRVRTGNREQSHASPPIPQTLLFEIEDTGPGIAPEETATLFEPFTQGKQSQAGPGLGLTISRQFVNLMGGDITVESVVGQGTTVKFNLQVMVVEAVKRQTIQSARNVIGLASDQPTYRILVVEDNRINRLLLVQILTSVGFEVREALNGQEAIEVWQNWCPHLIWMDIQMPVMDGYEATKRIKVMAAKQGGETVEMIRNGRVTGHSSLGAQPTNLPVVIALTATVFEEEQFLILASGCDDFVSKPLKRESVFAKMAEYLGVRYIYRE